MGLESALRIVCSTTENAIKEFDDCIECCFKPLTNAPRPGLSIWIKDETKLLFFLVISPHGADMHRTENRLSPKRGYLTIIGCQICFADQKRLNAAKCLYFLLYAWHLTMIIFENFKFFEKGQERIAYMSIFLHIQYLWFWAHFHNWNTWLSTYI